MLTMIFSLWLQCMHTHLHKAIQHLQ